MSIKRRLEKLEAKVPDPKLPWSPPEVYARLRREARAEIELAREDGEEPRYWIDAEGIIHAADDDRVVRHYGDYLATLDREISRLNREIAENQEEEDRTDEEEPLALLGGTEANKWVDAWWRRREEKIADLELEEGEGYSYWVNAAP